MKSSARVAAAAGAAFLLADMVSANNALLVPHGLRGLLGEAPMPTAAPSPGAVNRAMLKARALTADGSETCGFITADALNPLACDPGYQCAYNSVNSAGGCCNIAEPLTDCYLPTACIDYTAATNIPLSSIGFYTIACLSSAYPSCANYILDAEFTFHVCDSTIAVAPLEVVATFSDTTALGGSPTAVPSIPAVTVTAGAAGSQSQSGSVVAANSAGSSPSSTPFVQQQASGKTGLSTGAIVGIAVVVAAVVLAALAAIAIVFYKRNKDKRRAEEQRLSQAQMMMGGHDGRGGGPGSMGVASPGIGPGSMPASPVNTSSPFQPPPMSQHNSMMPPTATAVAADGAHSASGHESSQFDGSGKTGMITVSQHGLDGHTSATNTQWNGSQVGSPVDPNGRFSPPPSHQPMHFSGGEDIMSNDGTASVLPQHPHNPPHIG